MGHDLGPHAHGGLHGGVPVGRIPVHQGGLVLGGPFEAAHQADQLLGIVGIEFRRHHGRAAAHDGNPRDVARKLDPLLQSGVPRGQAQDDDVVHHLVHVRGYGKIVKRRALRVGVDQGPEVDHHGVDRAAQTGLVPQVHIVPPVRLVRELHGQQVVRDLLDLSHPFGEQGEEGHFVAAGHRMPHEGLRHGVQLGCGVRTVVEGKEYPRPGRKPFHGVEDRLDDGRGAVLEAGFQDQGDADRRPDEQEDDPAVDLQDGIGNPHAHSPRPR